MKWLFTLYSRVTNNQTQDMKELLIKRIKKPIRIQFKNKIVQKAKIFIEFPSSNILRFSMQNGDYTSLAFIKSKFNGHVREYSFSNRYIEINIKNNSVKSALKLFIESGHIQNSYIKFIYKNEDFFLALRLKYLPTELEKALNILGLSNEKSMKVIKKSYKKLVKQYHPDTVYYGSKGQIEDYSRKFQLIKNSYDVIKLHYL